LTDLVYSLHDTIYNATGKSMSETEVIAIASLIPEEIMSIGCEWGWYDTEFCEKVYKWAKCLKTIGD
jgi:hypothetical protein